MERSLHPWMPGISPPASRAPQSIREREAMRHQILPETNRRGVHRTIAVVALVVTAFGMACAEPPSQPPEAMMESDDPAAPFLGAWELVDWRIVQPSGEVIFPYGEEARGQIVYTDGGRMSAHLMELSNGSEGADDVEGGEFQSFHYWGDFTVDPDAGTVTHHVIGSSSESWVGSDQVRGFEFLGEDRVILTAPRTLSDGSTGAPQRLTWLRVQ